MGEGVILPAAEINSGKMQYFLVQIFKWFHDLIMQFINFNKIMLNVKKGIMTSY